MNIKPSGIVLLLGGALLIALSFFGVMRLVYNPQTPSTTRTVTLRNDPDPRTQKRRISPSSSSSEGQTSNTTSGTSWPPETVPDDDHPIKWTGENFSEFTDTFDGPLPEEWTSQMKIPSGRRFHVTPIIPGSWVAIRTDKYEVIQDDKGVWYNENGGNASGSIFSPSFVQIRAANRSSVGRRCVVSMVR